MLMIVKPDSTSQLVTVQDIVGTLSGKRWEYLQREAVDDEVQDIDYGLYITPSLAGNCFGFVLVEKIKNRPINIRDMPDVPPNIRWSAKFPWLFTIDA